MPSGTIKVRVVVNCSIQYSLRGLERLEAARDAWKLESWSSTYSLHKLLPSARPRYLTGGAGSEE